MHLRMQGVYMHVCIASMQDYHSFVNALMGAEVTEQVPINANVHQ